MERIQIFDFAKRKYSTEPDYPWKDRNAVLRHDDNNKWFAVVLEVGRDKLGLAGEGSIDVINLKCDPILIGSLCSQEGFHPAYHMNKDKWISIRLDGSVSEDEIKNLISLSYELTGSKKKTKQSEMER
ncbi:MAG: MmcQ/YjbR family DNA-binding protein [Oscillospiraceae bacterium]|nr:MmcQ/YjbR family DNA-binding protein [Oscillospiraceae bacterium]